MNIMQFFLFYLNSFSFLSLLLYYWQMVRIWIGLINICDCINLMLMIFFKTLTSSSSHINRSSWRSCWDRYPKVAQNWLNYRINTVPKWESNQRRSHKLYQIPDKNPNNRKEYLREEDSCKWSAQECLHNFYLTMVNWLMMILGYKRVSSVTSSTN